MRERIYLVDAFAEAPFGGNPAAVCRLDEPRDAAWMQALAAELNQSETAFLHPAPNGGGWALRWFTPRVEVDLCGHATLASAHVLWQECGVAETELRFHTRSGTLRALREEAGIVLDFPADPPAAREAPQGLAAALGVTPRWTGRSRLGWLAVLDDERQVRELWPDLAALATVDGDACIVTAPGAGPDLDFVSRTWAPRLGIPEDPVTGAAHCVLGPYWGARLGRTALRGHQASARGGVVGVRTGPERVELIGRAVTILEGMIRV